MIYHHFSNTDVHFSKEEESLVELNKSYLAGLKRRLQWMDRHENDRKVEKKMSEMISAFECLPKIDEMLKSAIAELTQSKSSTMQLGVLNNPSVFVGVF